jgi:hypothetical protein
MKIEGLERKPFTQRYNAMRTEAEQWRPAWTDIRDYIAPTRGQFEGEQPNRGKKIDHEKLVNGHASRSLTTLASGMTSGLTSPSRPWFQLGTADPDLSNFGPVKLWLSMVQQRMMSVFAQSNIYSVLNSIYAEGGGFGTAAMALLPDYLDVIRGRSMTIGEYFLGLGPDYRVNSFARQFWMTASQLVAEYGIDNVSEQTKTAFKNGNVDVWKQVKQIIEPNDQRVETRYNWQGKRYRSVHWEEGSPADTFLRVAGFNGFPILAPRWSVARSADIYGIGPGWEALGDVKMLQKMEIDKLIALDKVVDPPVQGDANIDFFNLMPGGVTRNSASAPNAGVKPTYQIEPDFNAIENSINKTEDRIDRFFYADLFMLISNDDRPAVTAREIVERHEEKLLMLGPVLENLESELLDPMIDRTFEIMQEAGLIPPPPQALQGHELKTEYISILAQAQKMVGTTAIEQAARFIGSIVAVYPDAADNMDADQAVRKYADKLGVDPEIIRDDEALAALRKDKADEAAAAKAAQAGASAIQGANVLSKTPVGQNSALDAVLAGIRGGEPPIGGE